MPDDALSSLIPRSRVTIIDKGPEPGAQGEELPDKIFLISELTSSQEGVPLTDRDPVKIDSVNFDRAMKEMKVEAAFTVRNTLSGKEDDQLPVELKFEDSKSFDPSSVASQVPQLRDLVELRKKLLGLQSKIAQNPQDGKEIYKALREAADKLTPPSSSE